MKKGKEAGVSYNTFAPGRNPQVSCNDQVAILHQLSSPTSFYAKHKYSRKKIPVLIQEFQQMLEQIMFLDPVPLLMRSESPLSKRLQADGSNLAGVLRHLWRKPSNKNTILNFIKSLPEQDISCIKFYINKGNENRSFRLLERFGKSTKVMRANLLSDGTLRVLAIAAAILSVKKGSTLVIEEVDNGIHPSRAKQLLATMQEIALKRNLRLLLTTHNPAMMDAVPNDALSDVVFCYRCPKTGASQLQRLSDQFDYIGLMIGSSLGEVVTSGRVDNFVKNPSSPEKRRQWTKDWLASMQEEA